MLIRRLERYFNIEELKEDLRKLGVNFITAGIVGIFVNHFVGATFSNMFWASLLITPTGLIVLSLGLLRGRK